MGLCCSTDDEERHPELLYCQQEQQQQRRGRPVSGHLQPSGHFIHNPGHRPSSPYGLGAGIAMMMQQATALAAPTIDLVALEGQVRKAKAEGRTVTATHGCIYFDYQLVARLPPGVDFRA